MGVIPAPRGLANKNEFGLLTRVCPEVRLDILPLPFALPDDEGLPLPKPKPNDSSDKAVIGVGGVDSRPLGRGIVVVLIFVCGEIPSSAYPVRGDNAGSRRGVPVRIAAFSSRSS